MEIYKSELKKASDDYELAKSIARKSYIERNKEASIGSIVTDGNKTIKVLRIFLGYCGINIWYSGKVLTKKLEIRKDGKEMTVIQSSPNFKVVKDC